MFHHVSSIMVLCQMYCYCIAGVVSAQQPQVSCCFNYGEFDQNFNTKNKTLLLPARFEVFL